jgi:hypothetical protein
MPRQRLVAVAALEAAAFAARLIHSGTASKTSAAPRSRRAQAARKLWTAAGSKYVSSPCAVTSTAAHAQRLPLPEGAAAPKRSANG